MTLMTTPPRHLSSRHLIGGWLLAMSLYTLCASGAAANTTLDAARSVQDAATATGTHASGRQSAHDPGTAAKAMPRCLAQGDGYLRARIAGAIQAELDWGNEGTDCTGAVRPDDGIRIRFSRPGSAATNDDAGGAARKPDRESKTDAGSAGLDAADELVLVFGIAGLREGQSGRALPVNLTVIREGSGQFYSTRGDDKCLLDDVTQTPIAGPPRRSRSYRIVARGFCTEPARAVRGSGAILLSRFDFAGRVDFETQDADDEPHAAIPDD